MRLTALTTDQERLVVHFEDDDAAEGEARRFTLEFEAAEGGLLLRSLTVLKDEGGLVGRDTRIALNRAEDEARRFAAMVAPWRAAGESEPMVGTKLATAATVTPERRKGRAVPDAFLHKVADAYQAAGDSITGLTSELDPAFSASDSTKYRWVKAARERGILAPRED